MTSYEAQPAAAAVDSERTRRVKAAVKEWTGQLIDLGGRNTLLYYRDLKQGTLDLTPDPAPSAVTPASPGELTAIEPQALRGVRPDSVGRLLASHPVRLSDLFSAAELPNAARRVRTLRAKSSENQEERGLETLFLAWGMATWTNQRIASTPAAPVLLRQAHLKAHGGAAEDFDLSLTDEWDVNPTLIHFLKTEFGCDVDPDALLALLAEDEESPDSSQIFEQISTQLSEQVQQNVPSFSVAPRVVMGNFSYAKLAMVLDIENSLDTLVNSPLICAIAGDEPARAELRARHAAVTESAPDQTPPGEEFLVLDADASQSFVVNAAVGGADLVVEGPPGTGKSQTIANLIATLAARGKRVLFVAEKRAAIDAVLDRLERVGLGEVVLDLHEGAGSKKKVAASLAQMLAETSRTPLPDLAALHDDLVRRRATLVARTQSLHYKRPPWDLSAYDLLARLPGFEGSVQSRVRLDTTTLTRIDAQAYRQLKADLESFVGLGGLTISPATSAWGSAFVNGSVTSAEAAQQAQQMATDARASALPEANTRLEHLLAECRLKRPAALGAWKDLFNLLDGVAATLAVFAAGIFEQNLDQLVTDLAPLSRGGGARLVARITNGRYRQALKAIAALGRGSVPKGAALDSALKNAAEQQKQWQAASVDGGRPTLPADLAGAEGAYRQLSDELRALGAMAGAPDLDTLAPADVDSHLDALLADTATLHKLPELARLRTALVGAGLAPLLRDAAERALGVEQATSCLDYVFFASLFDGLATGDPRIGGFDGTAHLRTVDQYHQSDKSHIGTTAQRVRREIAEEVTAARDAFPEEAAVVQHQARLKRGHMPIRQLFQMAPHVLGALKPCWAMSPLVVSQLLPGVRCFDIVIFDEASQVTPANAVGALMRSGQAVVAGDPHQLPPTNFFMTSALTSGGGEDDEAAEDQLLADTALTANLESVLDVMAALLPPPIGTRTLGWHYRSKDERLIAFSNAQPNLYDGALTSFPGVLGGDCLHHVLVPFRPGRVGQEDSASDEVVAVVDLVADHARRHPHESLGVIAMGIKHANRIDEAVRRRRIDDPALDAYLDGGSTPAQERFFVKNLERVQGDERDAIILTIGYGKSSEGRMLYRFGPLNTQGGERRLNVAVTRARARMTVVSSFSAAEMDQNKLNSDGAKMLCNYLAYAESGGERLGNLALSKPELNPFERDVRDRLTAAGIPLVPQLGASGYYIDFAAQHPDDRGRYVLAIECDGVTYHSCETARDRDRLRQEHLERLGWTFHRIWSQEWFYHREQEVERAVAAYRVAVAAADTEVTEPPPPAPAPASSADPPATRRTGPCPIHVHGGPINEYSEPELVALVRWIESDTLLRTEEELLNEARLALGYQRNGTRIRQTLTAAIHASRGPAGIGVQTAPARVLTVLLACRHTVRVQADPATVVGRVAICQSCGRQQIRQLL